MSSHYVPIPIINGRLIISYPHHICQKKSPPEIQRTAGWRMERRGHSFARSRRDVTAEWGHFHCRRLHNLRVGGLSLNISSWFNIYILYIILYIYPPNFPRSFPMISATILILQSFVGYTTAEASTRRARRTGAHASGYSGSACEVC